MAGMVDKFPGVSQGLPVDSPDRVLP